MAVRPEREAGNAGEHAECEQRGDEQAQMGTPSSSPPAGVTPGGWGVGAALSRPGAEPSRRA